MKIFMDEFAPTNYRRFCGSVRRRMKDELRIMKA
jgi:hypothetical protein